MHKVAADRDEVLASRSIGWDDAQPRRAALLAGGAARRDGDLDMDVGPAALEAAPAFARRIVRLHAQDVLARRGECRVCGDLARVFVDLRVCRIEGDDALRGAGRCHRGGTAEETPLDSGGRW